MRKDPDFDARLIERVKKEIPGFSVEWKSESRLQRALGSLLFFVPGYMTNYTTVMFDTMYLPEIARTPEFNLGDTLAHEFVHLWDAKNDRLFNLKYLFPQALGLLAVGAFWNLWFLLALVFLLPIPAPWRMKYELRGYTSQLAMAYWAARWPDEIQDIAYWVPEHFTNGSYYWMWPFKESIQRRIDARVAAVKDGSLLTEQPYAIIKAVLDEKPNA